MCRIIDAIQFLQKDPYVAGCKHTDIPLGLCVHVISSGANDIELMQKTMLYVICYSVFGIIDRRLIIPFCVDCVKLLPL